MRGGFKTGYSGMFDVPVTRHEIGHQFSQSHTVNNGGNKFGYAHSNSFHQLASNLQFINAKIGKDIPTGNTIPSVSAGPDVYIPVNTPYQLSAIGFDPDPGDILTYVWDGLDAGIPQAIPVDDDSQGALFMRLMPTQNPTRSIPRMSDVTANENIGSQEQLPTQEREMNIRVTVNDGHEFLYDGEKVKASGVSSDDIKITVVNNGGAFKVTSQSTAVSYSSGSTQVVTWKVAGTNKEPINCTLINIKLSVDGGLTYPYTLASGTANDGREKVFIPAGIPQSTARARIKVECASFKNVRFFDVSRSSFTINSNCQSLGGIIYPASPISGATGEKALNLTPNVIYEPGTTAEIPFRIDDSKPRSVFGLFAGEYNMTCTKGCCEVPYDVTAFTVDQTGIYELNFVFNQGTEMASVYRQKYDPKDHCTNFMLSGAYETPGGVGFKANQKIQLEAGETYYLVVHRLFSSGEVTGSMQISSESGGRAVMRSGSHSPPVSDYNYTYAAVNASTGTIEQVSEQADFRSLSGGTYHVYGISYHANDAALAVDNSNQSIVRTKDQTQNLGKCLSFSQNYVVLKVEACDLITVLPTMALPTNPATNTYAQGIKIIYEYPPGSGSISVNGQDFPITGSPQFETLNGLSTDEKLVHITAFFTANPDCTFSVKNAFKAPSPDNHEQKIVGEYRRYPVENDWHIVYLERDENKELFWRNKAGAKWKVTYQDGTLIWDSSSPYGEVVMNGVFEISKEGSNVPILIGFGQQAGEFYKKVK